MIIMTSALLLSVSITFAVINNLLFHGFKNKGLRDMGDILLFNAAMSLLWIVIIAVLNRGAAISLQAFLWGIAYGVVMAAFLLCKMQAMATGPVSVTSFIGCSSLLISTLFGVIFFKESVTVLQIIGVVLLIFALFLTLTGSGNGEKNTKKRAWFIWCGLFFLCSGATGIIFKLHQASPARNEINQMLLSAAATSAVLFGISALAVQWKTDKTLPKMGREAIFFVIACAIVSCGYNRLNISLSGMLPSIIFFPLFNGSVIILASLLAAILFKEKITLKQLCGMLTGIAALLLTAGVFNG